MPQVIQLGERFNSAFGFVGETGTELQQTTFEDTLTGGEVFAKDGRSTYENFTLRREGVELQFAYGGILKNDNSVFAPPALCSFKHSKRIGSTIVSSNDEQGSEVEYGEVVENYGRKPVEITIRGLLIDMVNHNYPGDKIKQLMELFHYNGVWEVEGQIWRDHKIASIYFTDLDDGPVQGFMDTWQFTINAQSIKPVEYFMKKNN